MRHERCNVKNALGVGYVEVCVHGRGREGGRERERESDGQTVGWCNRKIILICLPLDHGSSPANCWHF